MLVHVEHVHQGVLNFIRLASHLGNEPGELSTELEKLSLSNSQVALCCNELAALSLTVIKTAPCTTSKELSSEVQSLSHNIARAGKNLNHLLKRVRLSRRGSGRTQPQISRAERTLTTERSSSGRKEAVMVQEATKGRAGGAERRKKNDVLTKESVAENSRSERVSEHLDSTEVKTFSTSVSNSTLEEPTACDQSPPSSGSRLPADYQSLMTGIKLSKPLELVSVATPKHTEMSNATGQVISESPSNSPPHQTHPQNGCTAGHVSDEEDSSII